jgi:bifunctional non-homologous end joining protein LigD
MKLLKQYKKKRNFEDTPEPKGSLSSSKGLPRFCVQKHDASHLHYDFRLEYKGVLLSWAVPKGPSIDPKDKRLAIKVEDHPLEYQYFEGVIPQGNYGAGTVETWDAGTFHTPNSNNSHDIELDLKKGLAKGHLHIILNGEKLKGEFNLLRLKNAKEDNAWLLIKQTDTYSEELLPLPIKKTKFPDFFSPMLATLIKEPFDDEDWLFEIKWDGFRSLTFINQEHIKLRSRTDKQLNSQFPDIIEDLKKVKNSVILDGEIVVLDATGKSAFHLMQNYQKGKGALCYYVFDILFLDGKDLRDIPLITRKEILKKWISEFSFSHIRYCDHVIQKGKAFFNKAAEHKLEGIIGKKLSSTYQSKRSSDWVKIKTGFRQEVIIGGFSSPRGSRKKFGSLLAGIYNDKKELEYVGRVGGGFTDSELKEIYAKMQPLIQVKCPFIKKPPSSLNVQWVKPKLTCDVAFSEWTKGRSMRHPVFQGSINDKENSKMPLTHLEKVYWKEEGYTKGDLITYYESIAPYILPYLKDRPIMLHRYPDGIDGKDFYQKDLPASHPEWIKTVEIFQEGKPNHYLLIQDVQSLLYAVNLGSIDLHPFLSRFKKLDHPDWCIIDLDPHDISFDKVIEVALLYHELLEKIHVPHFCKTSGGKGLHIIIPLQGQYTYEQSRQFAEIISTIIHEKKAKFTSLERSPAKRPKKIYLDCLQNRISQSIVSPYSVRPRPHALVSCPLKWEEVNTKLDPSHYTMKNTPRRVEKMGDVLLPLLKEKLNLKKALDLLKKSGEA